MRPQEGEGLPLGGLLLGEGLPLGSSFRRWRDFLCEVPLGGGGAQTLPLSYACLPKLTDPLLYLFTGTVRTECPTQTGPQHKYHVTPLTEHTFVTFTCFSLLLVKSCALEKMGISASGGDFHCCLFLKNRSLPPSPHLPVHHSTGRGLHVHHVFLVCAPPQQSHPSVSSSDHWTPELLCNRTTLLL